MSELLPSPPGASPNARTARAAPPRRARGVVVLHAAAAAAGPRRAAPVGRSSSPCRGHDARTSTASSSSSRPSSPPRPRSRGSLAEPRSSLSEQIFAELREDFMRRVLALPLSTVERAGTGDLVSRTTADVDALARTVRFAVPETLIAAITTVLTVARRDLGQPARGPAVHRGGAGAVIGDALVPPRAPRATCGSAPPTPRSRARSARPSRAAARSTRSASARNASGGSTPTSPRPTEPSAARFLRTLWFPTAEFAYVLPVAASLAWGGWLVSHGPGLGRRGDGGRALRRQLADPVDRLISWLDEIQVGATSFARLVGIAGCRPTARRPARSPRHDRLRAHDVRYAYTAGRDVLHGIDLDLEPGERVAVVGPSGAGKSTLGRLLAGIHPPRTGRVEVGGVRLVDLPLETLRQEVALVTQEQHVFVGTLPRTSGSPGRAHRTTSSSPRSPPSTRSSGRSALPEGLETVVGAGGYPLTPPQAQQVALARLVLADPHTLVLDEATSLLDPRAARHLERSLAVGARGPDGRRDRAPAPDRARRRPRRGGRGRPPQRGRHPRRARRARRSVRRALGLLEVVAL